MESKNPIFVKVGSPNGQTGLGGTPLRPADNSLQGSLYNSAVVRPPAPSAADDDRRRGRARCS